MGVAGRRSGWMVRGDRANQQRAEPPGTRPATFPVPALPVNSRAVSFFPALFAPLRRVSAATAQ